MRIVTLKVPDVEVERWDAEASRAGVKRSEWIRRRCGQNGHLPDMKPNVAQTAEVDTSTRNLPPAVANVPQVESTLSGVAARLEAVKDGRSFKPDPKPVSRKRA